MDKKDLFLGVVLFIFLTSCNIQEPPSKVVVIEPSSINLVLETDKQTYESHDVVNVFVINNENKDVTFGFRPQVSWGLLYLEPTSKVWLDSPVGIVWCPCNAECAPVSQVFAIKAGQKMKLFEWNQKTTFRRCFGEKEVSRMDERKKSGTYRIQARIFTDEIKHGTFVYSNEFNLI